MTEGQSRCTHERCVRVPHKASSNGRCIFHARAEDKNRTEFNEALREYVSSEILKGSEQKHNFRGFIFPWDIDFKKDLRMEGFAWADFCQATFKGNASFDEATFIGIASFTGMKCQGPLSFRGAKFKAEADFRGSIFEGKSIFSRVKFDQIGWFPKVVFQEVSFDKSTFRSIMFADAIFTGKASLRDITCETANFDRATFEDEVDFLGTTFNDEALFRETVFAKFTVFTYVKFGFTEFYRTAFRTEVNFSSATFKERTSFTDVKFKYADFARAKFLGNATISSKSIEESISFEEASIENMVLSPLHLEGKAQIDFTEARLRDTTMKYEDIEDHIKQEIDKDYGEAQEIYRLLKNNFHTIGGYDGESWAFKKEKDMERKSYFHVRPLKWFVSMFWNLLYGYGERPLQIFGWCGFLLLFSSFIYWLSKGVFHVMGTCLVPVGDYWNNLYFSVVTFTTLGYGDFRPIGPIKVLASIEALLGIFLIALFIFALARKTGGR